MNREWYDKQYADPNSHYGMIYTGELPIGPRGVNQWNVDLTIGLLGLEPSKHRVLEIGAGVGWMLDRWENRGYQCHGVDFSQAAIDLSRRSNITCADASNMPFEDGEFDVVFSCAFLEHVSPDHCDDVLKEMYRVGKTGVHLIDCLTGDPGDDPSHINVKTRAGWQSYFTKQLDGIKCYVIPNVVAPLSPLFIHVRPGHDSVPLAFATLPPDQKCSEHLQVSSHSGRERLALYCG